MKLVVTGRVERSRRMRASASMRLRSWWSLKRLQSSIWAGLGKVGMAPGGATCSRLV